MSKLMQSVIDPYLRKDPELDQIEIGDTIRVHTTISEGDKDRIQIFEGVVIRWKKGGINSSMTVRKISHGVGVERIFPIHSPTIAKFEVKTKGVVRRARLYYLRGLSGKAARIRTRGQVREEEASGETAGA